jgi:T5SS/PEP-CTERM-associated repeat protein
MARLALTLVVLHSILGTDVGAVSSYWTNPLGGSYSNPLNWSPNGVPVGTDSVVFTNPSAYTLTIDMGATNSAAFFHQGSIMQHIPAGVWLVTNEWRVGESAGSTSRVTAVSGLLAVTNTSRSGVMSVGRAGTGELAILGGSVATDTLLATNGSGSILTFGHGDLTSLQGVTVSNGGKLTLGTSAGNLFVWNIPGGTNRIITSQFTYGGLTLGAISAGRRAKVNLTGSNTVLNVPGLDTYGWNEITISGGAKFQTRLVQLGLQSGGSNNVVVISDPGSSWINDYLMYFGMHSGAQTMIISNGGYFKTGGTTYQDQHFTAFSNPGRNRLIVTGSNSWFHSDGAADFGQWWGSPPWLDNLVLITNGGRFWARQLSYGSTNELNGGPSKPGTLVDVADGSLWIGSLTLSVGRIRIGNGTGTFDQLIINGGTNAVLETTGDFLVGHQGNLLPGQLRIGGTNAIVSAIKGDMRLNGWIIGALAGNSGSVSMVGGKVYVTNSVRLSASPGSTGLLKLDGMGTTLIASNLTVGSGGGGAVSNSAVLQVSNCTVAGKLDVRTGWATVGSTTTNGMAAGTLRIGSNGQVAGDGNIIGRVLVDTGGHLQVSKGDGALTITGDYQQMTGGLLGIQIGGTNAASQHGVLIVTGNASVAGTLALEFINGYAPLEGDVFQILQFGTNATGGFDQVVITGLAPGFQYTLQTNSNRAYVLTALNAAAPSPIPKLSISILESAGIVSWPLYASNYTLQSASLLAATGWVDHVVVSNAYQFTPSNNSRLFRLIRQ